MFLCNNLTLTCDLVFPGEAIIKSDEFLNKETHYVCMLDIDLKILKYILLDLKSESR